MKNTYSVGQVNRYIKNMFTQDYLLQKIYVKGEVSNCKYHTSGHIYFSLKDETGTLNCVMFAGHRRGLAFREFRFSPFPVLTLWKCLSV